MLTLAAYLRLAHLPNNPGWYTDEATHLDIAQHLVRGETQYFAVTQSLLLFGRMPLFDGGLALLLRLGGEPMLTLRALTGTLGVITVGVAYGVLRSLTASETLALMGAGALAVYPPAVLYSRFGFSYNLLAPLVLLVWWGLARYWQTQNLRALFIAASAVGIGLVSDLWMGTLVAPVLLICGLKPRREIAGALALLALPITLYAAWMWLTAPQAFLFDVRYTLTRLNALPLAQQWPTLVDNVWTLMQQDMWLTAGALGLALLPSPSARVIGLALFVGPVLLLGRTVALYSLSAYYLIPVWPMAAVGCAVLAWRVARVVPPRYHLIVGLMIAIGWGQTLTQTLTAVTRGFETPIDIFLIAPHDARAVAAYLNQHRRAEDVIIASPPVGWLVQGHVADFQMSIAYTGVATPHLPANLPAARWAFDPSLPRARWVVIDNLWHNWAAPNLPAIAQLIEVVEQWPLVFSAGQIHVYENVNLTR